MKRTSGILLIVALAVAATDTTASAQPPANKPETNNAGRYQIVVSGFDASRVFILDTATGQCWSKTPGGEWRDEGNPAQGKSAAPPKPAQDSAPTLSLPSKSVDMTIVQREERAIPGSDGSVRIRLGDITEGQVLLSVVTTDDKYLLETTSVSVGSSVEFSVGKQKYTIRVKELRNFLIGDDFAKISVEAGSRKSVQEKGR
jgi:hypothetical protein